LDNTILDNICPLILFSSNFFSFQFFLFPSLLLHLPTYSDLFTWLFRMFRPLRWRSPTTTDVREFPGEQTDCTLLLTSSVRKQVSSDLIKLPWFLVIAAGTKSVGPLVHCLIENYTQNSINNSYQISVKNYIYNFFMNWSLKLFWMYNIV